jgi:predicted lipid-binding transport protein (Tim44 family)
MNEDLTKTARRRQKREADDLAGAPALPVMTRGQWRGMLGGGLVGALIGALIALPFGFISFFDLALGVRLIIVAVAGAAAGATAGALYFGGRIPELSGESYDVDGGPSAGSTLADPNTDERGR